jgi:hypothetical protein
MNSINFSRCGLILAVLFSTPTFADSTSDTLLSNQSSAMESNLEADAAACATGNTAGTIGAAIKDAIAAHTQIASATPNVESLFDINSSCFTGASNLFDLSSAIPSLAQIINSAQQAVLKYAEQKVCTAVSQVSTLVTTPINQAITTVKGYSSFADTAVDGGMNSLDPSLGSQYHTGNTTNYSINVNPFNSTQSTSTSSSTASSASAYQSPAVTSETSVSPTTSAPSASSSTSTDYVTSLGGMIK